MTCDDMATVDPPKIDLLVDGELDDAERQAVLRALDAEPGGWRRWARAFLETACWRDEIGAMLRQPVAGGPERAVPRRRGRVSRWRTFLAVAASVVLAFLLGAALRDVWRGAPSTGPERRARVAVESPRQPPTESGPSGITGRESVPGESPAANPGSSPWQTVTLAVDEGPDGQPALIPLPVRRWDNPGDPWRESLRSAVPAGFLQALREAGYPFRQDRRLVPLRLEDGRQLVFPVDQVEFDYRHPPVIP